MPAVSANPPPPRPDWALFLDIDGTLLDIAPRPDAVIVPAPLRDNLGALSRSLGAVALLSGRPLSGIDALFAPLVLPAAGQHGAEVRNGAERLTSAPLPSLRALVPPFRQFADANPGIVVEDKGNSIAVHFRQAPGLADAVRALADRLAGSVTDLEVMPAKMAVDIKPRGTTKSDAIAWFMARTPFAGRVPVFLGDDRTDESGFAAVNDRNGISVKVGGRSGTAARFFIESPVAVREWIAGLARYYREAERPERANS